jgi:hypothetical protein
MQTVLMFILSVTRSIVLVAASLSLDYTRGYGLGCFVAGELCYWLKHSINFFYRYAICGVILVL